MCGRYLVADKDDLSLINKFIPSLELVFNESQSKIFGQEAYPSGVYPILTHKKEIAFSNWGYKKWDDKGLIINARSEGITTSNYFRPNISSSRCLILASSYYEWETFDDKSKIKYQISLNNNKIVLFAGLLRKNEQGNNEYVIITKKAQEEIHFIHSRMPLIISLENANHYLDSKNGIEDFVKESTKLNFEAMKQGNLFDFIR